MGSRWLGWTAVAFMLLALWVVEFRASAEGRELTLVQATPATTDRESFESPLPRRADPDAISERAIGAEPRAPERAERAVRRSNRLRGLISGITIFVIAIFLGVELINRVPATLHTPLMSGSNAISGITVVGAIIVAGVAGRVAPFLGFVAVVLAMINVVGGFLVTHRMLLMFKRR